MLKKALRGLQKWMRLGREAYHSTREICHRVMKAQIVTDAHTEVLSYTPAPPVTQMNASQVVFAR